MRTIGLLVLAFLLLVATTIWMAEKRSEVIPIPMKKIADEACKADIVWEPPENTTPFEETVQYVVQRREDNGDLENRNLEWTHDTAMAIPVPCDVPIEVRIGAKYVNSETSYSDELWFESRTADKPGNIGVLMGVH